MRFPRSIVLATCFAGGWACRGSSEPATAASVPPAPVTAPEEVAPAAPDAGLPLAEAAARALLEERFRGHGYRIHYDVTLSGPGYRVTVDGYDPAAAVGYEYVASIERGTDLTADERVALAADPERKILVVDPSDAAALDARINEFLAGVVAP